MFLSTMNEIVIIYGDSTVPSCGGRTPHEHSGVAIFPSIKNEFTWFRTLIVDFVPGIC